MPPTPCKRDSMQNNPHSRRVREIFPAFLGKVRKETLSVTCGDSSPEGGAFRHLPVSRAKPPPFGGGGFAKQRRRGFRPLAPSRSFPAVPRFRRKRRCICRSPPRPLPASGPAERPCTLTAGKNFPRGAARILNRPAPGGLHHKIRCFLNAVLRKVPLLQRHPPGGKIRVACALPRL